MTKKLGIPMFTDPTAGTQAHNHPEGTAFYKNLVDIVSPEYDAISANGTGLVLGATNDLPIPVGYDLGSDTYSDGNIVGGGSDGNIVVVNNISGNNYNMTYDGVGDNSYIRIGGTVTDLTNFVIECSVTINTPTFVFDRYNSTITIPLPQGDVTLVDGINYINVPAAKSGSANIFLYVKQGNSFDIDFEVLSIKEVTTTGYLTYETDDGVVQIGNAVDGGSSEELVVNGDFSDGDTGWTSQDASILSVNSGNMTITNTTAYGGMHQGFNTVVGRTYVVALNVLSISNGISYYKVGTTHNGNEIEQITATTPSLQKITFVATTTITYFSVVASNLANENTVIDNISVKEILPNSTTYTLVDDTYRWAYVNENPFSEADLTAIATESNKIVEFAMDGTGLTNTQGVDDKFYGFRENTGAYCVDALSYGIELLTNGNFNTGDLTGWTVVENGQTVENSNNSLHIITDGTGAGAYQSILTIGKMYTMSLDYIAILGALKVQVSALPLTLNATKKYTYTYIANSTDFYIYRHSGAAEGYIDNVSNREATASEIADYTDTIRTSTANSQTSIQWTCAELDGAGVPTAYNSTPNTAIMHSDTSISTGFKPNIARYSIEETVTGELQDFGGEMSSDVGFDTPAEWTLTDCTIADSKLSFNFLGNAKATQDISFTTGTTILITVDIESYIEGTFQIRLGGGGTGNKDFNIDTSESIDTIEYTLVSNETNVSIISAGAIQSTASFNSLSVKELTTKTQRTEQRLLTNTDAHLGVEEFVGASSVDNDEMVGTPITDGFNLISIADTKLYFTKEFGNLGPDKTIRLYFDANINSGKCTITRAYTGTSWETITPHIVTNGSNTLILPSTTTDLRLARLDTGSDSFFDIDFTNISAKEISTQNKYYIDGVEQAVTPALPDPAVTINLNDTAAIGYPDTIQMRSADFKIYSEVVEPTFDLDHDGLLDTVVINDPSIGIITVDDDSINVDLDGDGDADIIIPRT